LLDFPMSEKPGQSKRRAVAESLMPPSGAVTKIRRHMPIGRLLDFIWDEAGLTKWTAGWEDSRSWGFARELMINVARNLGTRHANFCAARLVRGSESHYPKRTGVVPAELAGASRRARKIWAACCRV
jgi:hypothetical protein